MIRQEINPEDIARGLDLKPHCLHALSCLSFAGLGNPRAVKCTWWSGTKCTNIQSNKGQSMIHRCVSCGSNRIVRQVDSSLTKRRQRKTKVYVCLQCGYIFKLMPVRGEVSTFLESIKAEA